nr:hypothetical protein [Gluconobacter oxydans]
MFQPDRRSVLRGAAAAFLSGAVARAATREPHPADVMTQPVRDFGPHAPPAFVPDPDILTLDPSFSDLVFKNGNIERIWSGGGAGWKGRPGSVKGGSCFCPIRCAARSTGFCRKRT